MAPTSTSGSKGKDKVMDAFHGIAPSASTSAPKLMKKPSYDVFINHRGPDVKSTLASVLYGMLTGVALSVFLDAPELEYGDFLPRTIEAAMSSALLHIAIISKRYAESPWCLAELSFMLKSGAPIIPIFYHVDPSDLRYIDQGKGIFVDAFNKHEEKDRYSLEQLQEWKKALHVVSFYSGEIIKNKDDEDRVLKDIVNTVLKKTKNVSLKVADYPVGMEEIVKDFEMKTIQPVEGDQGAQIIGIWGMGGSGKTTLAKELYNKNSSFFKWSSFVSNVRDASTKGMLYDRQKKILQDLGVQDVGFYDIEEGKQTLSRHLRSIRVLIVLDDVNHVDQLHALMPSKDRLESNSLIIVTTREHDVLKSWDIAPIYKMKALDPFYAKQLFCWHVFGQSFLPYIEFQVLVKKFVEVCHGLPLSLKVIGRQLRGQSSKECWEFLLHKIMRIVPYDIQQILKISYDTLDDQEKEMFLDVACFFIGEKNSLAIEIWNELGWSGGEGWKRLFNKCLVELDDCNFINMHDHIRDLGRDIAKKQSPYRFWLPQPIINVQNQREKRIGIQGIMATSNQIEWKNFELYRKQKRLQGIKTSDRMKWKNFKYRKHIVPVMVKTTDEVDKFKVSCSHGEFMVETNCGFWSLSPSLVGLKYLVIRGNCFNEVMDQVSRELVWLRWFQIGQRSLPSGLSLKNLRVLELYEEGWAKQHLEELWGETDGEAPVQLRQLLISCCWKFQGFPKSIGHLNHLKEVVIVKGESVTSLPDEFCLLQSLERLVLTGSLMLSLPSNFGNLTCLRHLDLSESYELRRLPVSFKNLMLLEHLNLQRCSQLTFKSEDLHCLQNITKLEFVYLSRCKQLEELPRHIINQVSLRELYFSYTSLRKLPDNIGQLRRLRKMAIENVLLTRLPNSFGGLSSLTKLSICVCSKLKCLSDSLGDLSSLKNIVIRCCPTLERLPDSFGGLSSLTGLEISDCPMLECLPDSLGGLSSLKNFKIYSCPTLERLPDSFGGLSSLTKLEIYNCPMLEYLSDSLGGLSSLTNLQITNCPNLERLGVKSLPKAIRQLSNLQNLTIFNCPFSGSSLSFGSSNLKSIYLGQTEVCRISFSEVCSPHLERLDLLKNHHLEEIEALPRTLQIIYLENCEMLKKIACFAKLTSLRIFSLRGWNRIEKIEGIENCIGLEELTVQTRLEVPSIESLENLQYLKNLELSAKKGSVIERCIQRIQKWPDEIKICARAVPEAATLVDSLLSPNLMIVDSISNQKIKSYWKLVKPSYNEDALMFCFVINCVSSQMTLDISAITERTFRRTIGETKVEKGRWAWVVFAQRSLYLNSSERYFVNCIGECGEEDEVEKGLVVRGTEQTLMGAVGSLLPLLFES